MQTLVAGGADTQLGSSCVLAPLATNVDLWKPIGAIANAIGKEFVRATSSRVDCCIFSKYFAKIYLFNHLFAQLK